MAELEKLFNESMKASAFHNYEQSEIFEIRFYNKAKELGFSWKQTFKIWEDFLMK